MLWISTRCLQDAPLDIALESLGTLTRGVEIIDEGKHRIPSVSLLESFPYKYSIRLPQWDINIASILEPIRQASVAVITERLSFASEIHAEVVINSGYVSSPGDMQLAHRQMIKSCNDLIHASEEYGVIFLCRNMGHGKEFLIKTPEDLRLMSQIPLALDIGHAHTNGCLPQFLHESGSRYFYLYDNRGFGGDHLEIGKGSINFEQVATSMYANGARGIIDVPTFRAAHNSMIALRRYGI